MAKPWGYYILIIHKRKDTWNEGSCITTNSSAYQMELNHRALVKNTPH